MSATCPANDMLYQPRVVLHPLLPPSRCFCLPVSLCCDWLKPSCSDGRESERGREKERERQTFLAELWELRRASPPTPVSPCLLALSACSQPFSCESSGNPTHMGPHMLARLCVCCVVCVCVRMCACTNVRMLAQ